MITAEGELKLCGFNIILIQLSAPITDVEEKIDKSYGQVQSETNRTLKQDVLLVMEDWKDNVGNRLFKNSLGN